MKRERADFRSTEPKVGGSNPSGCAGAAGPGEQKFTRASVDANTLARLQAEGGQREHGLRLAVLHGLWSYLDVLVRGEPGALRCSYDTGCALVDLRLAQDDGAGGLVGTALASEVLQRLAVLLEAARRHGATEPRRDRDPWSILLLGQRPAARGRELLLWLELGVPGETMCRCGGMATGVQHHGDHGEHVVVACNEHRTLPTEWVQGALEQYLGDVVSLPEVMPC